MSEPATEVESRPHRAGFRPEIEGIRAIACLLVAIFHIWLGRVSGGVDVFFTIAGFLVTVTLLGHFDRYGAIRPGRFLARLARRLVPAASVVLIAVIAGTVLLLPANYWQTSFEQIIASALYSENWYLALNAVDYLATDESRSPVQHFWAMSVQSQFYLIWVALFLVVALAYRLLRVDRVRLLAIGLSLVFVISLGYSIAETNANQAFAYFSTFTRVWEFALGGLLAIAIPYLRLPRLLATILGWTALAALVATGLVFPVSDVFPGFAALLPTVAAAAIVVTASTGASFGAHAFLGSKPMVWLGGLGYGIYLWHWPLLVFVQQVQGDQRVDTLMGIAIILVSIALAWLTRQLVERPVMAGGSSGRQGVRVLATSTAALLVVGVAGAGWVGLQRTESLIRSEAMLVQSLAAKGEPCFGAAAMDRSKVCLSAKPDDEFFPSTGSKNDVPPIYSEQCRTTGGSPTLLPCTWADTDSEVAIALIGNSHAVSWFTPLEQLATENGWRLDTYFKSSCSFATTTRVMNDPVVEQTCDEWSDRLADYLAHQEPYLYVFTSGDARTIDFRSADGAESQQAGVQGYREAWQPMIDRGTTVVAIKDYPQASDEVISCALDDPASRDCTTPESIAVFDGEETLALAARDFPGAELVDMTQWFCRDGECPAVIGNVQVYRDPGHFTNTYATTLTPFLWAQLSAAVASFPAAPSPVEPPP